MKEIKKIVTQISGRRNKSCYADLCYAVDIARKYQPQEPPMSIILRETREATGKSELALSKALSRAVKDIWEYGDFQELEKIYGRQVSEQPTPRELVYCLAEYVWREDQSAQAAASTWV